MILFSDGKRALLPFSAERLRLGLLPRYFSSPAGTYGGWLAGDPLTDLHVALLLLHLTDDFPSIQWRVNPFDSLMESREVPGSIPDVTHVLPLTEDLDGIRGGLSKGHRSAIRKAETEGVQVRLASGSADWEHYYTVYEDSLRRWGTGASSSYAWSLFEALRDLNSPSVSLWLALYDDQVVAGALCLGAKRHVVYWHGAALDKFFSVRPVHLLIWEAISHFHAAGYRWFDFNPSGGHEGVSAFKRHFGAISMPSPVFSQESQLRRRVRRLRGLVSSR